MERIRDHRSTGLTASKLRILGMLIVTVGIVGRGIFQNRLLGMAGLTTQQLLEVMSSSDYMMTYATIALIMQALETCAVPVFAYLLVEGTLHTSNITRYLLRVAGVAVLSEIPYNLAIGGSLLDASTRNPAFGLVLSLVMLYFYGRYPGKKAQNVLIKLLVTVAALVWASMLSIEYGGCMVIIVWALWTFRQKPMMKNLFGATATIVCSLSSPFFLAAPMIFLAFHFYNGEKGSDNRVMSYLAYPVILLAVGLIGSFAL